MTRTRSPSTALPRMSLEAPATIVAAVATRLPPFWPANPQVWFIQVEAQFSRRNITNSRTMYEEIVCALPTEYAAEVQDLLIDPPTDGPYEKLKELLIKRIADSERQKLRQLLTALVKRPRLSIVHFYANYSYNASPRTFR